VAAAVLVSLFISFTLDPMMSARVFRPIKPGHHERMRHHWAAGPLVRALDALDAYYRGLLHWALHHRKTVIAGGLALFVASLGLTPLMGTEFLAAGDRGEFKVMLEAPAGTSFAEMERIARLADARMREHPHVRSIFSVVAPSEEAHKTQMRVFTSKKWERSISQWDIQTEVAESLGELFPDVQATMSDVQIVENAGMERPIILHLRGEDYATLQAWTARVTDMVRGIPGTRDIDSSYRPGKPETTIRIDRGRSADLGVSYALVAQTVRLALEGTVVAKYRDVGQERDWDVRLQLSPEDRRNPGVLGELTVPATGRKLGTSGAPGGQAALAALASMVGPPRAVPIREVAAIDPDTGPATIERMSRQRQITVTSNLIGNTLGEAVREMEAKLEETDRPPGYVLEFGGQTKNMRDAFSNMALALAVAILFIYFVLASQFESFIHPFTIMVALPLALVGAMVALFVTGQTVSMVSLIGIVLLMGLVTKNSILLVDCANEQRAQGKGMVEALLHAGPTRLRPIIMTSAAMVLGMLPTALASGEGSEIRAPMGIAVIGGVITSTLLTLVVVPVVYTWMDRFTVRGRRERRGERAAPELEAAPEPEEKSA